MLLLNIWFSFASDDNISCRLNYTKQTYSISIDFEKSFICQYSKGKIIDNIPLVIQNTSSLAIDPNIDLLIWDISYNNKIIKSWVQLLYTSIWDIWIVRLSVSQKNKTVMLKKWAQEHLNGSFSEQEKIDFSWKSLYKISNLWWINPYIRFENKKYETNIYFSDSSKKYIISPTKQNEYNALYMQVYDKSTKKTTRKVLYKLPSTEFNDTEIYWKLVFDMVLKDNWYLTNTYILKTNTKTITVDINNPLNPTITKK